MKYILTILTILIIATGCISKPYEFDENKAYESLQYQANMLQRYPGGKDANKCRKYIKDILVANCDKYVEQDFSAKVQGKNLHLKNIIGVFNPRAEKFILLCSHYDNRPMCDKEADAKLQKQPCPGANDGASSTAVLLELGKVFHSKKPKVGVILVFFDGEDYAKENDDMYLGSKYFGENVSKIVDKDKIEYGILLDMIGDKELNICIEQISNYSAPDVIASVWKCAKELGYSKNFVPEATYAIDDDHVSLIECGIKCIDIIDFNYKYWHTTGDTADKCSPESLKIVGNVISKYIYDL